MEQAWNGDNPDLLAMVANHLEEGVIVVDREGHIIVYNNVARSIFGIDPRVGPGHSPGQLMPGDLVLIIDNALGEDDGQLEPNSLNILGIYPGDVKKGQGFLAMGEFGARTGEGCIELAPREQMQTHFQSEWRGRSVELLLDRARKLMNITIDRKQFPYEYKVAAGHMVILDGETREVKFYQARGYTARGEDMGDILKGKRFGAKGPTAPVPHLRGRNLREIHPQNEEIVQLIQYLQQKKEINSQVEYELNGVPVRCRTRTLASGDDIVGGLLLIEDISELKNLSSERDRALATVRSLEDRLTGDYQKPPEFSKIVGHNPEFLNVVRMADRAARSNSTILLLGESGTGKGLFARGVHDASNRKDGPFVQVNCAAIPESLLESELFGYQDGAFTGAKKSGKLGKFEMANKGTLFLDEIGDLSLSLQAKLLHVLQDQTIQRLGGVEPIELDIRIIAATNQNLEEAMMKKEFREDLYYRLNIISLIIPPLRRRKDDILDLIRFLLPKLATKVGKDVTGVSDEALRLMLNYDWPGNIRELENVLERGINLAEGNIILSSYLPHTLQAEKDEVGAEKAEELGLSLDQSVEEAEKRAIIQALHKTGGNRTEAARHLKVARTTLYNKMQRHGINYN